METQAITGYARQLHIEHLARRSRWRALAVRDDGIDLLRRFKLPPPPPPALPLEQAKQECAAWMMAEWALFMRTKPAKARMADDIPLPTPSIEHIQRVVCEYFRVSYLDIRSSRRTAVIVLPRQIAAYLAKNLTLRSLPDIGRRTGGRDHTTILHAIRKIARLRVVDPRLNHAITNILGILAKEGWAVPPELYFTITAPASSDLNPQNGKDIPASYLVCQDQQADAGAVDQGVTP